MTSGTIIPIINHEESIPHGKSHLKDCGFATKAIHGDSHLSGGSDISPPLHVTTTFRYSSNPDELVPDKDLDAHAPDAPHIYSRHTTPSTTRLEATLTAILGAPAITYSSGLSALHAFYVLVHPARVAISNGYHGSHGVLSLHTRISGLKKLPIDCEASSLQAGDVIHLETPLNPTGEALNIAAFAEKAHSRGAYLLVDSTFAPPGLQDPLELGADIVMHSGTKYLGGHSDMLCGVLATPREDWMKTLRDDRVHLGSVMGSLEGWLGVRSIKTLELRIMRQSENATKLVEWLSASLTSEQGPEEEVVRNTVLKVQHASLQKEDAQWLQKQMPHGFGPVFAVWMKSERFARRLGSKLALFAHATSLGGVESLIEWRAMSDQSIDTRVMRVSIGIENWEDLKKDLLQGFTALLDEEAKVKAVLNSAGS